MTEFALGKLDYKSDDRTVRMASFLSVPISIPVPPTYDFDKNRAPLPVQLWGNDKWGNCVEVGKHNQEARQYRFETRNSVKITEDIVVQSYKDECVREFGTAPQSPGDTYDNGLVVLYSLRNWRSVGLTIPHSKTPAISKKPLKIDVFGELDHSNRDQLRAACYLLTGVQFGISLPLTARDQIQSGHQWEDLGLHNGRSDPGSWGGHCVYSCHYDSGGFYVLTWGRKQYMTNSFIERYVDEVWSTVDALDNHSKWLDVPKLRQYLVDIGARSG